MISKILSIREIAINVNTSIINVRHTASIIYNINI